MSDETKEPRVWICIRCAERSPGEKPERCKVCGSTFVDVSELETGEDESNAG